VKGLKRFLKAIVVLGAFGTSAVTLTFFIVSQTDELAEDRLRMSSEKAPPHEPFAPRYGRWLRTVIGSGFTDFGQSHTGPVKNILADRLPVTAAVGFLSWVLAWGLGLTLAILLGTQWRAYAALHQERIYPIAQAIPSLVVVIIVSSGLLTQAVFSLSGLVLGSVFVEGVFRLGGVGEVFIEGATRGQAELTGFATLVYFMVTAAGVLFAEGIVIYLDPDGELAGER
jgi:ABC-type dipeptide/oligopeptide/nickel transport system permease component